MRPIGGFPRGHFIMKMPPVVVKVMKVPGGYRQFYTVYVALSKATVVAPAPCWYAQKSMGVAA